MLLELFIFFLKFLEALEHSLQSWRQEGKGGIWIQVPRTRTELVPLAIDLGFDIHHAQQEYIMLCSWLKSSPSPLPGYANHFVGVGAVVLNADDELLVVSERFQPKGFPETKLRFKLPGGHVDRQESLPDAVVREVIEETGVPVKFDNVVCFRHNLEYPGGFGNGDMYFAARCSPADAAAGSAAAYLAQVSAVEGEGRELAQQVTATVPGVCRLDWVDKR